MMTLATLLVAGLCSSSLNVRLAGRRPMLPSHLMGSLSGLRLKATADTDRELTPSEGCLLPDVQLESAIQEVEEAVTDPTSVLDTLLLFAPIVVPLLAALFFKQEVDAVHELLEFIAQAKWVQVDGGLSRNAALLPVITGIVLPCVSFALGTLTATTISTLRARQVQLRTELNTEACLIRSILSSAESLFPLAYYPEERAKAALLLRQYCSRVLVESRSGINVAQLAREGAANSELDGLTRLLHHATRYGGDEAAAGGQGQPSIKPPVPRFEAATEFLAMMYLEKLQLTRSERLAVLQTTFPTVHWLALSLLGVSVIFGFLLAADQQTLLFLAPIQLRLLFAVLVGALVSTACICVDLADPFAGAFQITPSSEQLYLIRDLVDQTLVCDQNVEEPLPSPGPPPMLARYKQLSF